MGPTSDSTPRLDEGNHPISLLSSGVVTVIRSPKSQICTRGQGSGVVQHSKSTAILVSLNASPCPCWQVRLLSLAWHPMGSSGLGGPSAVQKKLRPKRQAELSLLEEAAVRFVLLSAFGWGRVIFESHDNSHCWF